MSVTHIRRCHVCGTVNEMENAAVHRCEHCGKHLAPFYYFDESSLEGLKENEFYLSRWKESGHYNPIYGLSTYWSESEFERADS